jgi:hypothetical protein
MRKIVQAVRKEFSREDACKEGIFIAKQSAN